MGISLRKYNAPMDKEYHPEADETDYLGEKDASLYRGLMIGSANWMITLGRFDVAYATNAMARFGIKLTKARTSETNVAIIRLHQDAPERPNPRCCQLHGLEPLSGRRT
jgi:hypothetical protein